MLKKAGKLINLDFTKDSDIGPPKSIKFSRETATRIIEHAGFSVIDVRGIEPYSYLVVGTHAGYDEKLLCSLKKSLHLSSE
jgi:hypothetical protein